MKQLFWLVAIIFLVQCKKQITEPEIEYHTVRYWVLSIGDTTLILYKDQNGEFQDIVITRGTPTWQYEFETEKGTNLSIIASSYGGEFYVDWMYNLISVSVGISIDGGTVATDKSNAYDGECNCIEPFGSIEGWCMCTASASFAGILW